MICVCLVMKHLTCFGINRKLQILKFVLMQRNFQWVKFSFSNSGQFSTFGNLLEYIISVETKLFTFYAGVQLQLSALKQMLTAAPFVVKFEGSEISELANLRKN